MMETQLERQGSSLEDEIPRGVTTAAGTSEAVDGQIEYRRHRPTTQLQVEKSQADGTAMASSLGENLRLRTRQGYK